MDFVLQTSLIFTFPNNLLAEVNVPVVFQTEGFLQAVMYIFGVVWVYFGWGEKNQPLLPQSDWLWGCHIFLKISWRWTGVPRMIVGGADRIRSGSSTNLSPLEYGGSGPERKGSGVLLRCGVWSGRNGQKGKRALPVAWHKMNYCHLSAPLPHSESRVWRAR